MTPKHLGQHWEFLLFLARKAALGARMRQRLDASDIVQDAMLAATKDFANFQGTTEAELRAWLARILRNRLVDALRREGAQERDPDREESMCEILSYSTAKVRDFVDQKQPSPSEDAGRREFLTRLIQALERLPENQRDVVYMRDLMQMPVAAIAEEMGLSEKAVAGLLLRGRRKLRESLKEFESGPGGANGR